MSETVKVGRKLQWSQNATETIFAHNKSGGGVVEGDIVILDTSNSSGDEVAFTTTASANNKLVLGMVIQTIATNGYGQIQTKGPTSALKVNGTSAIVAGDHLATYSAAKIGQKAGSGFGGAFAIALTGYANADSSGVIEAWLTGSAARIDTSSLSATFASPTITGALSVSATTTFTSTGVVTMDGVASATDVLTITLGDLLISDGHLDIVEANGTTDVLTLTHTTGVMASDEATLKVTDGGDIASGGNMVRLVPTGTPNAASILLELVGAGKIGQAMYIDEDPTGIDVVHFHGGGALTNGFAVLGITNDGNLATGGALLNLTLGGTPGSTAVRVFEIDGQKDAIAVYIDSDAAAESAFQITGNGVVASNKAMLDVTNTAAIAAGSSLARIHSTAASAGATAYGLEIACNASNLEALYVSLGTSRFDELIRMNGTTKIEFLDTGLYIYSSTNGVLDIVSDTTVAISGAVTADSTLVVTGAVTANATTESTSVTTGALIDKGGLGVAKDFFLGGDLSIATGKIITTVAELTLNSVNPLTIQFGGVDWMQWDEAAISSFAGAADTAGHAAYMETEDGGADGGSASGKAGGLYSLKTGDGSVSATSGQVGGAGGALSLTTGGGQDASGAATSGAGGVLSLVGVAGYQASGASGTGGAGGDVLLSPGALGGANGGTAGRSGRVVVLDGRHMFIGAPATPGTNEGQNWLGIEDGGADPSGTLTNSLAIYTPDAGDSLDFLHADGTTDSLGT